MAKFGYECRDFDDVYDGSKKLEQYVARTIDPELSQYMGMAVCLMVRLPNSVAFGKLVGQSVARGFTGPTNRFDDGRMVAVLRRPLEFEDEFPYPELEFVQAHADREVALGPVSIHFRIARSQYAGLMGMLESNGITHEVKSAHNYRFVQVGLDGGGLPEGIDVRFRIDHTPMDVARATLLAQQ